MEATWEWTLKTAMRLEGICMAGLNPPPLKDEPSIGKPREHTR